MPVETAISSRLSQPRRTTPVKDLITKALTVRAMSGPTFYLKHLLNRRVVALQYQYFLRLLMERGAWWCRSGSKKGVQALGNPVTTDFCPGLDYFPCWNWLIGVPLICSDMSGANFWLQEQRENSSISPAEAPIVRRVWKKAFFIIIIGNCVRPAKWWIGRNLEQILSSGLQVIFDLFLGVILYMMIHDRFWLGLAWDFFTPGHSESA